MEEIKKEKILFIFFGFGEPNSLNPEICEHWTNFFNSSSVKNLTNLHIIVHPLVLSHTSGYRVSEWTKNVLDDEKKRIIEKNMMVANESHHIKSAWGSMALTYIPLMMMQQAIITNGNIYKKHVLITPSCGILYNFDVIYDIMKVNTKTWILCINNENKDFYKRVGSSFVDSLHTPLSFVFASPSFVIDHSHLDVFFHNNTLLDRSPTYIKNGEDECKDKTISLIESKYTGYKKNLENVVKSGTNGKDWCTISEELFFATLIFDSIFKKGGIDAKNPDMTKIFDLIHKNFHIVKHEEDNKHIEDIKHTHIEIKPIKNKMSNYGNENGWNKKWTGKCKKIKVGGKEFTILEDNQSYAPAAYCNWGYVTTSPHNVFRDPSIQTEWKGTRGGMITMKPETIADMQGKKNVFMSRYVNENNDRHSKWIFAPNRTESTEDVELILTSPRLHFKAIYHHPLEYGTWTMLDHLNMVDLLIYGKKRIYQQDAIPELGRSDVFPDDRNYDVRKIITYYIIAKYINCDEIYSLYTLLIGNKLSHAADCDIYFYEYIYHKSLDDNQHNSPIDQILRSSTMSRANDHLGKTVGDINPFITKMIQEINHYCKDYEINTINSEFLKVHVGHSVTANDLNNALNAGSILIRKCIHGSGIDKFSDQLFGLKTYVCSDDGQSGGAHGTKSYLEKYIKYKNKYLNLRR